MNEIAKQFRQNLSDITGMFDEATSAARKASYDGLVANLEARDLHNVIPDVTFADLDMTDAQWGTLVQRVRMMRGSAHAEG